MVFPNGPIEMMDFGIRTNEKMRPVAGGGTESCHAGQKGLAVPEPCRLHPKCLWVSGIPESNATVLN